MRKCHSIVILNYELQNIVEQLKKKSDENSQIMQKQQQQTNNKTSVKILISCANLSCISLHIHMQP